MQSFGIYQLLNGVLSGYSVCVMAYGPTGSGKTHTITGTQANLGIRRRQSEIPWQDAEGEGIAQRAGKYLLEMVQEEGRIAMTYVEVYNEAVYDLLGSHDGKLPVKWTEDKGFHIAGAKRVVCRDVDTINTVQPLSLSEVLDFFLEVIEHGMQTRRVASHQLNGRSSRSHTILTMDVQTPVTLCHSPSS